MLRFGRFGKLLCNVHHFPKKKWKMSRNISSASAFSKWFITIVGVRRHVMIFFLDKTDRWIKTFLEYQSSSLTWPKMPHLINFKLQKHSISSVFKQTGFFCQIYRRFWVTWKNYCTFSNITKKMGAPSEEFLNFVKYRYLLKSNDGLKLQMWANTQKTLLGHIME